MKIVAKKGFEIEIVLGGEYRECPMMKGSFEFGGKTISAQRCELQKMERLNQYRVYFPEQNGKIEIEKAEYEKIVAAINELPEQTTRTIDADGDIVTIEIKKDEPKAEPKTSTKRGIENIIFDNESEGVDKYNGIGVDKFAMVGIENVKSAVEVETAEEITIEKADVEKLGDISAFEDFDPDTDFPLYVDEHAVENKDRVRLYYGNEFWNDLLKLEA